MNDEFLHRLRKEPPPAFAARLKTKLSQQKPARHFSLARMLLVGIVAGGSALAATFWISKSLLVDQNERVALPEAAPAETPERASPFSRPSAPRSASVQKDPAPMRKRSARDDLGSAHLASDSEAPPPATKTNEQAVILGGALARNSRGDPGETPAQKHGGLLQVGASTLTRSMVQRVAEHSGITLDEEFLERGDDLGALCAHGTRLDFIVASRRATKEDLRSCSALQIAGISEAKVGNVAIVLSAAKTSSMLKVSARDLFLALARWVPVAETRKLVPNPNLTWRDVNPHLELVDIAVFGPAPDSPLAQVVASLVLEAGCDTFAWIEALKKSDPERYRRICHSIREDGPYVSVEENDVFASQRLLAHPNALALVSFDFYTKQRELLVGTRLNGAEPTIANIRSGSYAYSRAIYLYNRQSHLSLGTYRRFQDEFLSLGAGAAGGYLAQHTGLVALNRDELPVRIEPLDLHKLD